MQDEPSGLLSELRQAEHRPSLLAFVLMTVVGSLVVATGIRVESVGTVLNPLPRWLFAIGSDLVEQEPAPPARCPGRSVPPAVGGPAEPGRGGAPRPWRRRAGAAGART